MWDSHRIRPTRNSGNPHGRPNVMYSSPSLWGAEDKLCSVTNNDVNACVAEASFRSSVPCDVDVFEVCVSIMNRDGLEVPSDCSDAIDLYFHLRHEIHQLIA